jgi:pSer/pThr/pTyr-binding forkhead associated (FHA) protein
MSNGSPPARRRSPTGFSPSGPTEQRPARRPTGAAAPRPPVPARPGTRLACTAGPKAGEDFALDEGEYVIGRSTDNAICIPDTSVSRRHVMVRKEGNIWYVRDLGSGNGTLVNGEPISDETVLSHGDVLTLGDTELTFQDTSNATMMMAIPPPSAPARPGSRGEGRPSLEAPRRPGARPEGRVRSSRASAAMAPPDPAARKRRIRMLLLFTVLFAGVVGVLVVVKQQRDQEAAIAAAKVREARQRREQLDGLFQDAKKLVRENKWTDAQAKLQELEAQEPDYPQLAEYKASVEKEIPNQQALDETRAALDKGELTVAAGALAKVTQDTQLFEQLRTVQQQLEKRVDDRAREAQTLLRSQKLDEAKVIIDDLLAVMPEHRDAKLLRDEIAAAIERRDRPPPSAGPAPAPKPWQPAIERFVNGDVQGALAAANECASKQARCKALVGQISDFSNLHKKMEDLDEKGLARLLSLDEKITDGRGSKMAQKAGTRAATLFYRSASSAKASGQWGRAMESAQRALRADPGHEGARSIVSEVQKKARDLYLQAYTIKDTNPDDAAPMFREVLSMTTPDDEYYQKAKTWLEKMPR